MTIRGLEESGAMAVKKKAQGLHLLSLFLGLLMAYHQF